jgi:Protein of unknown function (DUF1566)/Secretion system C-terminal sorting domain
MKKILFISQFVLVACLSFGQGIQKTMLKLPDTGQTGDYTTTFGEDSDYSINVPFFIKNNNGTVVDTITGLMWQQADGGEMTYEKGIIYADTLTLGGFTDWRLPLPHEAFSILNHQRPNPALDITAFTSTGAEYWWTNSKQANDATRAWVTNAGGGIGNHALGETISAGGTKKYHVRVVRNTKTPPIVASQFTDKGDGTIKDNLTGLTWQKVPHPDSLTWENALTYAEGLTLSGFSDWRLPNIKELQSISDEKLVNPSVSTTFFPAIGIKKYWSSTSLPNQTTRAWYLFTQFGITTYDVKTVRLPVLCVRGNSANTTALIEKPNEKEHLFNILKNPISNNTIHVEMFDTSNDFSIQLIDVQGHIVFNQHYKSHEVAKNMSIYVPSLQSGVYLLKIDNKKAVEIKKVVLAKN